MVSKPGQAGAAGGQFDSDQEVTTGSAAEELQRRNSLNLMVEILKNFYFTYLISMKNVLSNTTFKFYGMFKFVR